MIGEVIDDLKIIHSIACDDEFKKKVKFVVGIRIRTRVDGKDVSTSLSGGPIEVPVVLRTHSDPASLLKVAHDHGFVHVNTICHSSSHLVDVEGGLNNSNRLKM